MFIFVELINCSLKKLRNFDLQWLKLQKSKKEKSSAPIGAWKCNFPPILEIINRRRNQEIGAQTSDPTDTAKQGS